MRNYKRVSTFLLLIILSIISLQAADVKTISIPSKKMGKKIPAKLILPDSYKNSNKRFPVLYLLHGAGDTCEKWDYFNS